MKNFVPVENIDIGSASDLNINLKFDIILQSLVFTSILDMDLRKKIAEKMMDLCCENGIILWYDFAFDNPGNSDVKGIGRSEVRKLFRDAKSISFNKVTLAPPIGRRVGHMYKLINHLFFLRTHLIAVIRK